MTSSSLSINLKQYFTRTLRSYWWLMLLCGIIYFFLGPVYLLLGLQQNHSSMFLSAEELFQRQFIGVSEFFAFNGFYFYYVIAMLLASVIGIVMFAYLHHKQQVNFYHSQPIHRTQLFVVQYVVGLLVNFIPMLLMIALMLLIAAGSGFASALDLGAVLFHTGRILLFLLASYSISVLAGQLTGTVLTHLCMVGVLHFGLPVFGLVLDILRESFFHTSAGNLMLAEKLLSFAPAAALFQYFDMQSIDTLYDAYGEISGLAYQGISGMPGSLIAILLFLAVGMTAFSWWLYQKRPSENAGMALIYPVTQPFFKLYLMFIAAVVGGFFFRQVSDEIFFLFGAVAFGLLTHMACEVIINKDFKAMFKRMKHCACFLLIILAVVGVFKFDLIGYDRYLPNASDVTEVYIEIANSDGYYNSGYYGGASDKGGWHTDRESIDGIIALIKPIVEEKAYLNDVGYYDAYEKTAYVNVEYVLQNGRTVSRRYKYIDASLIADSYAALYDKEVFKQSHYRTLLQLDANVSNLSTFNIMSIINNYASVEIEHKDFERVLLALQKDLLSRTFQDLQGASIGEVDISWMDANARYYRQWLSVYPGDSNLIAELRAMGGGKDSLWGLPDVQQLVATYQEMKVYKRSDTYEEPEQVDEVTGALYAETVKEDGVLPEGMVLIDTITDPAEMLELAASLVTERQSRNNSCFIKEIAPDYCVIATKGSFSGETPVEYSGDRAAYENGNQTLLYFKEGQVPQAYQ